LPEVERRLYQTCKSLTARNGDVCDLYQFVLASDPRTTDEVLPIIGRVSEILQVCHARAQWDGRADYVLIEVFQVAGIAERYQLPLLRSQGWKLVPASALLCAVNVQHNCAANGCTDTAFITVREEREATSKTEKRIEHRSLDDLVLNTAQMRDAIYVQQFRIQAQQLDREQAIHAGAAAEIEAQKIKTQKTRQPPKKALGISR
ncbi:hypothetical protein HYDPIDRAFT_44970, partial [Hydnomerulius pinastri MD-312]